jgi:hypothetical protein
MGAGLFFHGAETSGAEAEAVTGEPTALERGADVRFMGTVAAGPTASAPFSGAPCLVARTRIVVTGSDKDANGKWQRTWALIRQDDTGPPTIPLDAGSERVEVPVALWIPATSHVAEVDQTMDQLPPALHVSESEIDRARSELHGNPTGFEVMEWTLVSGTPLFVVGHLDAGEGPLRLGPHSTLGKVVLFRGTQAEYVAGLRGSSKGLRIAGYIFIGVAALPLVITLLIWMARRRRLASTPT